MSNKNQEILDLYHESLMPTYAPAVAIASGKGVTRVGNDVLLMSYTHVAHDCTVGNHCILVSYVGIAGETDVDDWAILGGGTVAHQFSKIGKHAMVGGGSKINKDVPPYALCGHTPLSYVGVNLVGLRRRGFTSDQIRTIKDIYDLLYYSGMNISDACEKIEAGFPPSEEKDEILAFVRNSNCWRFLNAAYTLASKSLPPR